MLEMMGRNITHMGLAGSGQHTKMVNQILISTCMIGVCEGLLYAQKAGLPLEPVLAAVSNGAAGSWSLSNYGPRILATNFDPGFLVEVLTRTNAVLLFQIWQFALQHFVKDMSIALEEAQRMQLALPGLALAQQLYTALVAQGQHCRFPGFIADELFFWVQGTAKRARRRWF
jgi:3-hydroxyisobutyrate dehydrogenase